MRQEAGLTDDPLRKMAGLTEGGQAKPRPDPLVEMARGKAPTAA
jgi:hypothetical protein